MKLLLIFCLCACSVLVSHAQVTPLGAIDIGAERQRIHEQRAVQEANFSTAYAACFERFLVFDCQQDAKRARRKAMDELRRQEVIVNGLERQANAATTLQRINQNVSPEREIQKRQEQQQALQEDEVRHLRGIEKQATAVKTDSTDTVGAVSHGAAEPASVPNLSAQEQRYAEKLKEAKQHKQEKAQSLLEKVTARQRPCLFQRENKWICREANDLKVWLFNQIRGSSFKITSDRLSPLPFARVLAFSIRNSLASRGDNPDNTEPSSMSLK